MEHVTYDHAAQGIKEAREIFAENPAELRSLVTIWENYLSAKPDAMDRDKIAAFLSESRRLLAVESVQP